MADTNNVCSKYPKYIPTIIPAQDTIIVFGDIHGDMDVAKEMLVGSGVAKKIKKNGKDRYIWTGGKTHVVQVGDQIDRCRPGNGMTCRDKGATDDDKHDDINIMELFNDLDRQARMEGGMVISLLGNHELMNAMGHENEKLMDYVSYEGVAGFSNIDVIEDNEDNSEEIERNRQERFEDGMKKRIDAFKPGNEHAVMMGCTRYSIVVIGSHIFVHAGVIAKLINKLGITKDNKEETIEKINLAVKKWLLDTEDKDLDYVKKLIDPADRDSMFWNRTLGTAESGLDMNDELCSNNVSEVLDIFFDGEGHIHMGHSPQAFGKNPNDINSTCSGKIWRVDNGSSSAFNNITNSKRKDHRRVQYLKIENDTEITVCDSKRCYV